MKEELKAVVRYKRNYGSGKAVYFVEYEYKGDRYITGTVIRNDEKSLGWYFGKGVKGLEVASEIALLSDEEFSKAEDEKKYSWELKKKELLKGRENKLSNPNMEEKKYYDYFIENVQKTLGLDEEQVEKLKSVAVQYGVDWKLDPEPEENFSNPSNPKKHLTALQIIIISLRGEIITRQGVYEKYSAEYYEWRGRTEMAIEKELRDKNDEIEYMTVKEVGSNPIRELSSPNPITEEEVTEVKEWLDKIRKKRKIKGAISDKIVLEELKEEAKGKGGKS